MSLMVENRLNDSKLAPQSNMDFFSLKALFYCCFLSYSWAVVAFPKSRTSHEINSVGFKTGLKSPRTFSGKFQNEVENADYAGEKHGSVSSNQENKLKIAEEKRFTNKNINFNHTSEQNVKVRNTSENIGDYKLKDSPISAESNIHVLQTNQNYHDEAQGYIPNTNNVIVKELGNGVTDSSDYQDKVIYVPVYESSNPENGHGFTNQNAGNNNYGTNTPIDDSKKAVGFIGVVFVHKMQPEDAIDANKGSHNLNRHQNNVPSNVLQQLKTSSHGVSGNIQLNSANLNDAFKQQIGTSDEGYHFQGQQNSGKLQNYVQQQTPKGGQLQIQNQGGQNNAWIVSQNVPFKGKNQRPSNKNHGLQWSKTNNPKSTSGQNTFQNHPNNAQKNQNAYNKGHNQFQRPVPENPLFPTRGSPVPKTLVISKTSNSKTPQTNSFQQKPAQVEYWQNNNQQINPPQKSNQNFNPNDATFQDFANVINSPDGKGSGQFIPVIKHVVIEKNVPMTHHTLLKSNEHSLNLGVYNGMNQNHHLLQQSQNSNNLGYDQTSQKSGYNSGKGQTISNNGNFIPRVQNHQSQKGNPQIQSNQNSLNQHLINNKNHIHLNQHISNNQNNLNHHLLNNQNQINLNEHLLNNQNLNTFNQHSLNNQNQVNLNEHSLNNQNLNTFNQHSLNNQNQVNSNEHSLNNQNVNTFNQHSLNNQNQVNFNEHLLNNKNQNNVNHHLLNNQNQVNLNEHLLNNQNPNTFNHHSLNNQNQVNLNEHLLNNQNNNNLNHHLLNNQNQINLNEHLLNNQNQIHSNQYRRNGGLPRNEQMDENARPYGNNAPNQNGFKKVDKNNVSSNRGSVKSNFVPVLVNNNVKNTDASFHQAKGSNDQTPITQEFSDDAQIKEAFRVAGIYLQNQNNDVSSLLVNKDTRNKNPVVNSNVQYTKTNIPSNEVKPTTDERYNALVHEKSNNLNVIKLRDHLLRSKLNSNYAEPHKNLVKSNNEMSQIPAHIQTNEVLVQSQTLKENYNKKTPDWKVHQGLNIPTVITSMDQLYAIDRSKNIINEPKVNHLQKLIIGNPSSLPNEVYNHIKQSQFTDSFQMKDAISQPQTKQHQRPNMNTAQRNPDYLPSRNDAAVVFTGIDKDWASSFHNGQVESGMQQQTQSRANQGSHYSGNNSKSAELRHHPSGLYKSNGNGHPPDRLSKAWYQENKEKQAIKRGDDSNGASEQKDVDGADSNGFGSESFW